VYQYDADPRVRVDGSGGYTVTAADGEAVQVRYDGSGWGAYTGPDLEPVTTDAGPVARCGDPDGVFAALIGTPYRTATRADVGRPDAAEVTAMLNDPVDGW